MGKSTINGQFSIAMLVYQRVEHWGCSWCQGQVSHPLRVDFSGSVWFTKCPACISTFSKSLVLHQTKIELSIPMCHWPSQEPKLGLCKGISPQNMAQNMVQYLHFRTLKFPLIVCFCIWYIRLHIVTTWQRSRTMLVILVSPEFTWHTSWPVLLGKS